MPRARILWKAGMVLADHTKAIFDTAEMSHARSRHLGTDPTPALLTIGIYNRPMLISLGTGSVEPASGEDFVAESETSGFDHLSRFRNESPS